MSSDLPRPDGGSRGSGMKDSGNPVTVANITCLMMVGDLDLTLHLNGDSFNIGDY